MTVKQSEIIQILCQQKDFANLDPKAVSEVASLSVVTHYEPNQIIFMQEDSAKCYFIILEGKAKIIIQTESGKDMILRIMNPGASNALAIPHLFSGIPQTTSLVAIDPTTILYIPKKDYLFIINKYPQILNNVMSTVSERLNAISDLIEGLALHKAEDRILKAIQILSRESVKPIHITHREISEMTGTTRTTASLILQKLKNKKVIDYKNGKFIVLKGPNNISKTGENPFAPHANK